MGEVWTSLRVLASPGAVLALVVLALNDHMLKQAWPGVVTGKLSDFAGLVFAPLLLAVPLTLMRVRRPLPVAITLAGAGFVFCKTSTAGAALTSGVWSLFGTPTMIRADITDLIALPALYAAWRIHRTAVADVSTGWRRTTAVALGMAILPFGALATSATSCDESEGYETVAVLEGDFAGPPARAEQRLAAGSLMGARFTIDAAGTFEDSSYELADAPISRQAKACVGELCWRLRGDDAVEASTDGGDTWGLQAELTKADRDAITAEVGTDGGCDDEPPRVGATDIAALETASGVHVMVALQRGGVWQLQTDGTWIVQTERELHEMIGADRPPLPIVTELDAPEDPDDPTEPDQPGVTPTSTCATPTQHTVTPNPSNGPPTTYDVCP